MAGTTEGTHSIDEGVNRHEVYYLPDGAAFLVENVPFKIPRHMLRFHSPFFKTLSSLPTDPSKWEGVTDANPISIRQVTSLNFERLLALLYPLTLEYKVYRNDPLVKELIEDYFMEGLLEK